MGATYSDNPSNGIAHKSRISPKLTTNNVKWRSTKECLVQPERGQKRDREGLMNQELAGVEKGSETSASKTDKRQCPIRRKWGSGATTERGMKLFRDKRQETSKRGNPTDCLRIADLSCPRSLTVTSFTPPLPCNVASYRARTNCYAVLHLAGRERISSKFKQRAALCLARVTALTVIVRHLLASR